MLRQATLILLAFTLLAVCLPRQIQAQGQGVYGAIAGNVTDPTKAAVPNAQVTATNTATGVQTVVSSNDAGYFTVADLIAGTYVLEVKTAGFNAFRQENIVVDIGTTVRLDVTLVVGNVQQQITVSGAPPALQTEKVEVAGTITSVELESIPTSYNNATGFVKLLPGVMEAPGENGLPSSSGDGYFAVNVNGGRAQQNLQRLDGVVDTEFVGGSSSVVPPLDALEAVTADVANYDVEFGNAEGVVTSFTTKSGSNQWHGSGYEFNQVNATSARNPFTEPVSTGHFVWNQFGGTVGGPIKQNKAFVFGGYQGVRIRSGAPVLTSVPTAAFKTGDFSDVGGTYPIYDPNTGNPDGSGRTQFSNNIIPTARISPISAALLAEVPLPNQPGDTNNFIAPLGTYTSDNNAYGRVDYILNNSNRLFGRYTHNWQSSACTSVSPFAASGASGSALTAPPLALNYCTLDVGSEDFISADFVHVFSPTFVVEGRFGDMIYRWYSNELDQSSSTSTTLGLPGLNDACSACGGLAGFRIGGPIGAFDLGNTDHAHQINNEGNYEYVGIGTWTRGSHTIKFGTDIDFGNDHRFDSSSQGNFGCHNGSLCAANGFDQSLTGISGVNNSGLSQASFLLGLASTFQRIVYAVPLPAANQKRDALFVQDTWHVTRKLTAVLGLRWDYMGYPTSPFKGDISNFDYTNTDAIISNYGNVGPTAGVKENWGDFAPRVGFAYRITPTTVIRSGYAKSFSVGFYGANFGAITDDWPTANRQELQQLVNSYTPTIALGTAPPALVSGFAQLAAAGNPGEFPAPRNQTIWGADPHNPTSSIDEWNFTVQHQFGNNLTLTAGYIGNATRHLFYRVDHNAVPPGPGPIASRFPYAAFGYVGNAWDQSNQSSMGYEGLQVNLVKRYSKGLSLTTAVTWSKAYDFGSHNAFQSFDTDLDRAPEDGERALIISVGHVWELPFGKGRQYLNNSNRAVNLLVSGWKWSGISRWMSGDPLTPVINNSASLNSTCCTLRPNRIGSGFVSNPNASRWWNLGAFTFPAQYTLGTSGRNILRGPGFFDADWSLARDFHITEKMKLEIQWELLNAFNNANLGDPDMGLDSATGGQIFSVVQPMRAMQLGAHFFF